MFKYTKNTSRKLVENLPKIVFSFVKNYPTIYGFLSWVEWDGMGVGGYSMMMAQKNGRNMS
jgi:hypothetical protein